VEIIDSDHIKFAPDTLARLGEELIPNPDQGIIELVRNSYDADARTCIVDFSQVESKSIITIKDSGDGMDLNAIRNGWFVLGHSEKADDANKRTRKGRLPVGDKGLGRLAALRMGRIAILETRPKSQPGVLYRVTFDWSKYAGQRLVEDVDFKIEKGSTSRKPGTDITLKGVISRFRRRELDRLARNILLLSDPFGGSTGFKAVLKAPGFKDLEKKVRRAYFGDSEYRLEAKLSNEGLASAQLLDWRGRVTHRANHNEISDSEFTVPYKAVAANFSLWVFLLSGESFSMRKSSVTEVREWLSVVGGVHLYYRRLRVPPYGDGGHDWLEMNLARAKSPEERPSTNNSIGRVVVEDPQHFLTQKTDRLGFIESEQFHDLRRFAMDALEWMAKIRLREAETRRERERVKAPKTVVKAVEKLDQIVEDIPSRYRAPLTEAIRKVEQAAKREAKVLRDDLQLYRSLATAGTTAAVFAHEAAKPITRIGDLVNLIKKRALKLLGRQYDILEKPVDLLERSTNSLKGFTAIPIYLLKRDKRKAERVNVQQVIDNVLAVFEPILQDAKIFASRESPDAEFFIHGSVALVEAIVTNFLTNSVQAFNREDAPVIKRKIAVTTEPSGSWVLINFSDNGPGIAHIKIDEIWLPGRTTVPGGTGFGLTIVRDAVVDLGGTVRAIARGEMGGAEFIVKLPLLGD
jgi:signal transduction histidine kinase